jgi:hypothetical protein
MSDQAELTVELSASYAHRAGEDVHLVVQLADGATVGTPAQLQLTAGKQLKRVPVTVTPTADGLLLDGRVPAATLRPGVWRIAVAGGDAAPVPVEARLLNSRKQPIALLPGPLPTTQLPPPERTSAPTSDSGRVRAYRTAAGIANRGLALLPEERASKARAALKKVGRRVLG